MTQIAIRKTEAMGESIGELGARVIFDQIEKRYGSVIAVDGVSLDIAPGEFVTLLGPSGSGKTTTLMMLAGFEIPTAGEIYVDEDPIAAVPPYRRNIGMVFQNYALFPHMTVGENIAFPLQMRKMSRAEITRQTTAVLALVGLPG
jgi:putative spermidine/putrescine transport system ATP-binding protein